MFNPEVEVGRPWTTCCASRASGCSRPGGVLLVIAMVIASIIVVVIVVVVVLPFNLDVISSGKGLFSLVFGYPLFETAINLLFSLSW